MPTRQDHIRALHSAEEVCRRIGARLTRLRRNVLMLVLTADRPLTAYEILDLLPPEGPLGNSRRRLSQPRFPDRTWIGASGRKRQELRRLCDAGSCASQPNARLPTL